MNLEVMVSTMHQRDISLIEKMNLKSDVLIINQCERIEEYRARTNNNVVRMLSDNKRGLSMSRNKAIENSIGDVCLIADDDLVYVDGYKERVLNQFIKYPEADIIVFQVEGIEQEFKKYSSKAKKINFITSMKVASVEVAFKLKSIKDANIKFDDLFGAGSTYFMGEESIFLFDALKKNLKIIYVPIKIADLHIETSSWFTGYNSAYFVSKGACYTRMSISFSRILIFQFAFRKYKLFKEQDMNIKNAIQFMLEGRKNYLRSLKN